MLYVSYGGFPAGTGHLLEFSLYRHKVIYDRGYRFGIDSFDISHDGRLIFMPTGEDTSGNTWHVLAATTGRVVGAIAAGRSPHDTVVGVSGQSRPPIVGSRCYGPFGRMFHGSVSRYLVRHSTCPLLVLPRAGVREAETAQDDGATHSTIAAVG